MVQKGLACWLSRCHRARPRLGHGAGGLLGVEEKKSGTTAVADMGEELG